MKSGIFSSSAVERIVYGKPAAHVLDEEAARLGSRRIFLIVSGTMNRTTDEVARVRESLGNRFAGLYDQVPAFTQRYAVLEAAAAAKAADADLIVTFGGGAVVEAGKIVRLCLKHDIRDLDDFDAFHNTVNPEGGATKVEFAGPTIPQIAIPTTLSGGEFHAGGGSTNPRTKLKQSYVHAMLLPRVVVFDPAPTVHTPLWVWLSTGLRAIDHATEGICSQFSNPVSDASYLQALKLLGAALRIVKKNPDDLEARLNCQLGVLLAMAGRQGGVQMGASHAIGQVLGVSCGVPHGYTSCVLLSHVLRYNRTENASRQQLVAEALGHPGQDAAEVVEDLLNELGLPSRLVDVGIRSDQFNLIAANSMRRHWLHTNPRKITAPEQVLEILQAAA